IDVDLTEFEDEDVDMEALLAEADAAVAGYERDAPDTVPPPAPSQRSPLRTGTPGTSFAVAGRREVLDEFEPNERESQPGLLRSARPALLPTGTKPKVIRKVAREGAINTEPPPSGRTIPGVDAAPPSVTPARVPI